VRKIGLIRDRRQFPAQRGGRLSKENAGTGICSYTWMNTVKTAHYSIGNPGIGQNPMKLACTTEELLQVNIVGVGRQHWLCTAILA
jgi:hypothetical protein